MKPCALCLSQKPLRNSHIVPEFMYREYIYETKNGVKEKFMGVSRDEFDSVRNYGKGLTEELLCADCESKLSRSEDYAAKFFKAEIKPSKIDEKLIFFENLKYKELKLFFMSLLWRYAVTTRKEFEGAEIIDKHKEKLRQMLYNEDPGKPGEYPCFINVILHGGSHLSGFIAPPAVAKFEAHRVWQIVICGYYFRFFVSSHAPTNKVNEMFLTKSGKLILMLEELKNIPPLYKYCLEVRDAMIKRKSIPKKELKWPIK
jgi:hypothetical protein